MPSAKIDRIIEIARKQQFETILSQAESLQAMVNGEDIVEVVVLGQFKAGKSSLINSFLEEPVLPVGVLPVTAVITRLRYGAEKTAQVEFTNGQRQETPVTRLNEYITEKDNPENTKQVQLVELWLPELKPFKNIRFIDTPGIGSIFKHNTEVTKKWFQNIGAAIVVISVSQPLSEDDMELIRSAMEQSPEVYLLLSKTDLISAGELQEVQTFIEEKCRQEFDKKFPVFLYSTIRNNREFRHKIMVDIFKALSNKAHSTNKRIVEHKFQYLENLTKSYLEVGLQLQHKKEEERKALLDRIIDQQVKMDYVKRELSYIDEDYKNATRKELEELIIDKHKRSLIQTLSDELNEVYDSWKGNLSRVTSMYENWIREAMAGAMLQIDRDEREGMQQFLDNVAGHFNIYHRRFHERLSQNVQQVLGVEIPDSRFNVSVEPMKKANISVSWAFESHIDLLWFLIPMPLFRKTFQKYFLKQVPGEVEKNLRRLVSLLTGSIHQQIDELHKQSVSYTASELEHIREMLNAKPVERGAIKEMLSLLEANSE